MKFGKYVNKFGTVFNKLCFSIYNLHWVFNCISILETPNDLNKTHAVISSAVLSCLAIDLCKLFKLLKPFLQWLHTDSLL